MRAISGVALLLLMFLHALGPALAVLSLETQFDIARPDEDWGKTLSIKSFVSAIPYTDSWESSEGLEGLYRIHDQLYNVVKQVHQNDTLYVTLRMNESAWQRFSELSDLMQEVHPARKANGLPDKAFQLLSSVLEVYLPVEVTTFGCVAGLEARIARISYADVRCSLIFPFLQLHFPPPEVA
jgi:hypothetical protein